MAEIHRVLPPNAQVPLSGKVFLNHLQREKARFRTLAEDGEELRVFLDRGKILAIDSILQSSCGKNFWVVAAKEEVLSAKSDDWLTLSRACYHLGNRHVKLQVGDRWLRILPDHVLEDMLIKLGMCTQLETAEFVPESGAYTQFSKGHVHAHDH